MGEESMFMKRNAINAIFVILMLSSIKGSSQNKLTFNNIINVDEIEIRVFKSNPTSIYKTRSAIDLFYLKELITKAKNHFDLKCDTTGEIIYFKNHQQLFKVYFSSRLTGSIYKSSAVAFSIGNKRTVSLLNYGSGMLIAEVYYHKKH